LLHTTIYYFTNYLYPHTHLLSHYTSYWLAISLLSYFLDSSQQFYQSKITTKVRTFPSHQTMKSMQGISHMQESYHRPNAVELVMTPTVEGLY